MLTWSNILNFAQNGTPAPDQDIEKKLLNGKTNSPRVITRVMYVMHKNSKLIIANDDSFHQ